MMQGLKRAWKEVEDRYMGTKRYFFLSPTHYSIYVDAIPFFKKYIKGKTLDLGAGRLGWKFILERYSKYYFSLDIAIEDSRINCLGDGQRLPLKDKSIDTVVCLQMLEHVKKPAYVLQEISRILNKEGCAIISFPHLSYIHGEPHDYFRYTMYGLKSLCPQELTLEYTKVSGGLISFVCTPLFILIHALLYRVPIINKIFQYCLSLFSVMIYYIDAIAGVKSLFPLNYICCLKKK